MLSSPVVALLSDELHHMKSLSGMSVLMYGGRVLGRVSSVSIVSELEGWESSESMLEHLLRVSIIFSLQVVVLSGARTALLS